jgi:hypothetical protein
VSRVRPADAPEVLTAIGRQAEWAARRGLALNRNGTGLADREAGIFGGLHSDTRDQLAEGAGDELKRIHSLRSSTALTISVFQSWKTRPRPLGKLFGAQGVREIAFEQKQPIWPPSDEFDPTAPHLDVLLSGTGPTVAIESKFLELYTEATNSFRLSYFPTDEPDQPLWAGLPGCRHLADRVARGEEVFSWLGVAQLLKHALGLSKNQPNGFRLVLAWYRMEGSTADAIEKEIGRFSRAVSSELDFTAITYQELVPRLRALRRAPEPATGYYEYLEDRYDLGPEASRPLPLITLGKAKETKYKTDLAVRTASINLDEFTSAYYQTIARAPQRALRPDPYLMPTHDGRGGTNIKSREKVAAKAIFNHGQPLAIGDESVIVVDYEVPLAARQADDGVGDIDLFGLGSTLGRPWIIELKVRSNTEPPYSALIQALRYSAMLDANRRQISVEVKARTRVDLSWPAVIAVAADTEYWQGWHQESKATGDWLPALRQLATGIAQALGIQVVFVDLGSVEWTVIDGAAQLVSPLDIQVI